MGQPLLFPIPLLGLLVLRRADGTTTAFRAEHQSLAMQVFYQEAKRWQESQVAMILEP